VASVLLVVASLALAGNLLYFFYTRGLDLLRIYSWKIFCRLVATRWRALRRKNATCDVAKQTDPHVPFAIQGQKTARPFNGAAKLSFRR